MSNHVIVSCNRHKVDPRCVVFTLTSELDRSNLSSSPPLTLGLTDLIISLPFAEGYCCSSVESTKHIIRYHQMSWRMAEEKVSLSSFPGYHLLGLNKLSKNLEFLENYRGLSNSSSAQSPQSTASQPARAQVASVMLSFVFKISTVQSLELV